MDRAGFKPERFRVALQSGDSSQAEPVVVQIGLDGLKILSVDGNRTMRVYSLNNISRWVMRGTSMLLYTKTPADLEERQVTFKGDNQTVQAMLDTLTSSCMQMYELLQSGEMSGGSEAVNQLSSLIKGGGRKKNSSQISAEDIEFWHGAEKEGWMHSQGEIVKTWRRRFFVLKNGHLFRFASADIDSSSKPRGIVDLSNVTDITSGRSATGKPNSLKLSTASSHICYLADSETDLVEWMSALENALSEIVKRAAGVEEEDTSASKSSGGKHGGTHSDLVRELVKGFDTMGRGDGGGNDRDKMVSVVGYDNFPATAPPATPNTMAGGGGGGGLRYSDIDGIAGVVDSGASNNPNPIVSVNYGGAYNADRAPMYGSQPYPSASSNVGYRTQHAVPMYADQSPGIYPSASIIDQPQQQPTYPAFQSPQVSSFMASAPSNPNPWQVYFTPEGKAYYHNRATGHVQWERPTELAM
ncbi:hypothetical protein BSKO_10617 [Bryopsis sp. KO-2023]|nr:hypothetical protein BSKO_10617 [Bryopsis sp. KO-2023]